MTVCNLLIIVLYNSYVYIPVFVYHKYQQSQRDNKKNCEFQFPKGFESFSSSKIVLNSRLIVWMLCVCVCALKLWI